MVDRADLIDRLCLALAQPGVTGVLGTPDVIEDLLLLGALDDKAVFGSMNRGGLQGAAWEIDDRFTAYDAAAIEAMGYEGGKMLVRIDLEDPATAATVEACARAVSDLAQRELVAMVEPFMAQRVDGRLRTQLTTEAAIRASVIAAGLGTTSAHTWLKVPVVEDMERVIGATTLPTVLLGGEVADDQDATFASWERALQVPGAIGLVVGRSLLYPPDDDVAAAVGAAVGLLKREEVKTP
jgi:DhnA family fructose-bisphosphate aldolase class Ia